MEGKKGAVDRGKKLREEGAGGRERLVTNGGEVVCASRVSSLADFQGDPLEPPFLVHFSYLSPSSGLGVVTWVATG